MIRPFIAPLLFFIGLFFISSCGHDSTLAEGIPSPEDDGMPKIRTLTDRNNAPQPEDCDCEMRVVSVAEEPPSSQGSWVFYDRTYLPAPPDWELSAVGDEWLPGNQSFPSNWEELNDSPSYGLREFEVAIAFGFLDPEFTINYQVRCLEHPTPPPGRFSSSRFYNNESFAFKDRENPSDPDFFGIFTRTYDCYRAQSPNPPNG